jgi:hypothetical protein
VGPKGEPQWVGTPVIGECLWFVGGTKPVQTSPVLSVEEREGLAGGDWRGLFEAMRCVSPVRGPRHTQ